MNIIILKDIAHYNTGHANIIKTSHIKLTIRYETYELDPKALRPKKLTKHLVGAI